MGGLFFVGVHIGVHRSGNLHLCRPSNLCKFLLRNQIVSLKTGHGLMTGEGHYFKKVVPGSAKVIQGTMAEIMEGEVSNFCLFAGRLKAVLDLIEGLPMPEKNPIRVKSPRQLLQGGADLRMEWNDSGTVGLSPFRWKADEPLLQINLGPC